MSQRKSLGSVREGERDSESRKSLLSRLQLENLRKHKYRSTSKSLLDPLFQPFWNALTDHLPMWLAPNILTVSGLAINVITSLILLFYTPDLEQEVPSWACCLCGCGILVYQTLDAIDGKQARRTESSSPLGELFDHGCDSFSTVFLTLAVVAATQIGKFKVLTLFHCLLGSLLFYCVHWRTYMTGTLSFGRVDVTEAELTIVLVQLVSALFGTSFWTQHAFLSLTWGHVLILSCVPFELVSILNTLSIVVNRYGVGKNGSTVAGSSVISPAIPLLLAFAPMIWLALSTPLYTGHPALFILTTGLIASKVTDRLIVAHMTKSHLNFLDRVLLGPFALLTNQFLNFPLPPSILLWLSLFWAALDTSIYCSRICREICEFLHIQLFSIDYAK